MNTMAAVLVALFAAGETQDLPAARRAFPIAPLTGTIVVDGRLDDDIQAVAEGSRVFAPLKLDAGVNVGVYAPADKLVAAGLVWKEAQPLLAERSYLMDQPMGRGHVIAFAEDPNYRAFTAATELLFINAVLLGPGR